MSSEHLHRMAVVYSARHATLYERLEESLDPRGPEMLFDVAGDYLGPDNRVLDIGCRDGRHLIELVRRYGCRGVGLDPVDWNVERARAAIAEAGLADRLDVENGVMERIGQPDEHFDLVWCRDMLVLVEGLDSGLSEAARVLKPDGAMLLHTNFATELLAPAEAAKLLGPPGNRSANYDEARVEDAFGRAGLVVERKDVIGTEWREHEEERVPRVSRDLLRVARLRRRREELVAEFGPVAVDIAEASLQWTAYQFLGKLQPVVYVLRRRR